MSVLVDTNVLLRSAQPDHPMCQPATRAVATLLKRSETVFFCPQNIAEFWHVATRPISANGLGLSEGEVIAEVRNIEELLTLLPENAAIYPEWKRIVSDYRVRGVKVFDARLVAVANTYGVGNILIFNRADFERFSNIDVLEPSSFLSRF